MFSRPLKFLKTYANAWFGSVCSSKMISIFPSPLFLVKKKEKKEWEYSPTQNNTACPILYVSSTEANNGTLRSYYGFKTYIGALKLNF